MTDDNKSEPDLENVELDDPSDDELETTDEIEELIADVPQELTESEDEDGNAENGGT